MDRATGLRNTRRARQAVVATALGLTAGVTSYVWASDGNAAAASTTTATGTTTTQETTQSGDDWAQAGQVGPGGPGAAHAVSGGS